MALVDEYARIYFLRWLDNSGMLLNEYLRKEEIVGFIYGLLNDSFKHFDIDVPVNVSALSEGLFEQFLSIGVIGVVNDPIAGDYYSFIRERYIPYRTEVLNNSDIDAVARRVGDRFFRDVFVRAAGTQELENSENGDLYAPASDRIVTINHNAPEAIQLDEGLETLRELVRTDNSEKIQNPSDRPRFMEQIKAAKELVRLDRISVSAISSLLVPILTFLSLKFADEAIGELAASLLGALKNLFGI